MTSSSSELTLIQKVELRLALAKTPEAFQIGLNTYLAPLLLKFASPDAKVKAQMMSTTKFLLSRFNSSTEVKIPIDSLLDQIKTPNLSSNISPITVQTYSLLFISKGIDRLDEKEGETLFTKIWESIHTFDVSVAARLFNIGLKVLVKTSSIDRLPSLVLNNLNPESAFILEKFYKFMLLSPTKVTESGQIAPPMAQQGLSATDVSFFSYQAGVIFSSSLLSAYKTKILKLLENAINNDDNSKQMLCFIIAAADADSSISTLAINTVKRTSIDYESPYLISTLIDLFVGNNGVPQVKSQLQERILQILCKSEQAGKSAFIDQISIIGLSSSNIKLKQATVLFIRWFTTVSINLNNSIDDNLALNILNQLKLNLSTVDSNPANFKLYLNQRQMQYEILGFLLKKNPHLITLSYVKFLIHMIKIEITDLKSTIQILISSLGIELQSLNSEDKLVLKQLLNEVINDNSNNLNYLKYVAIKLINSIFDFHDTESRFLNILALNFVDSTKNVEIVEEAKRGLHPYWFRVNNNTNNLTTDIKFPRFSDIIKMLNDNLNQFNSNGLNNAIKFAWQCLIMNSIELNDRCLKIVEINQDWEVRLEKAVEYDDLFHQNLVNFVNSSDIDGDGDISMDSDHNDNENMSNAVCHFISFLLDSFLKTDSGLFILQTFYKLLSISKDEIVSSIAKAENVNNLLNASSNVYSDEALHYNASIIGIVSSHSNITDDTIISIFNRLLSSETPEFISVASFIYSRLNLRDRIKNINFGNSLTDLLINIDSGLASSSSKMIKSCLDSISQLSIFDCISDPKCDKVINLKSSIKLKLKKLVKQNNEVATLCWAYFSLSFHSDQSNQLNEFETCIYETYNTKFTDYLFTSGECWSILGKGWDSKVMKNLNDVQSTQNPRINPNRFPIIFQTIMESCFTTKPALRKAGCIWLLSLVQFCHDGLITSKMKNIQQTFMRFLSDKEEIIQESASRGLSIVYENGDSELQDVLVHDLLASFTDSNRTTKDIVSEYVDKDTQLFDNGVLATGGGESVNTYKDVLSLASEIGDPSLVYKFMSLAKNSALWSSRKGIAFGLGAILDKSKLDALLKANPKITQRLIPKLWRYKHDPNVNVSRTMNEIWNSLISEPKTTITQNYNIILKECLSGMGNHEWRIREASASALHELLNQVEFSIYEDKLDEIWLMSFRSMDDIKSSVRKEGEKLTKFLSNTMIIKISNSDNSLQTHEKILKQLIPFLLGNSGLLSDVEDVKNFAFETIIKLINTSSKSLKSFVTEMVQQMVLMMSSVEPQFINYIALNADKYKLQASDIDSQRLGMVGSSPMMNAIEKLLPLLDDDNVAEFIEMLKNCVKTAVGLPSKVAASKVIVDLIIGHLFVVKNYGDSLLKIATGQLKDRNDTVAKSYGMASGYAVRSANIKAIQSLARKLNKYYFEKKEDSYDIDRLPKISSYTCECIFNFSNDKFQSVASAFLPLVFIGKHDPNEEISSNFKKVWGDATNSSSNAIKLYFTEIITLVDNYIESTNFNLRRTIGLSIIDIINQLGDKINEIKSSQLDQLFNILLKSLTGRSYDGKEKLLQSLVLLAKNSEFFLSSKNDLLKRVSSRIVNEAKRNNYTYSKFSIQYLGQFLSTYNDNDSLYDEYLELMQSLIASKTSEEDSDSDTDMTVGQDNSGSTRASDFEFHHLLINNLISSLSTSNINTKTLQFTIQEFQSHLNATNINTIKSNNSKHKYKLSILNILRRLIIVIFGDRESKVDPPISFDSTDYRVLVWSLWHLVRNVIVSHDELQSILIPFIRISKTLLRNVRLTDYEKDECLTSLKSIKDLVDNNVVSKEVNNVLATTE